MKTTMATAYEEFIRQKIKGFTSVGFQVSKEDINPLLFEWQNEVTRWAIRKGRCALFEHCGLGKSVQELEWGTHVARKTGGNILMLAPLSVAEQTHDIEAPKFGYQTTLCRTQDDVRPGINITNYEMIHHFKANEFSGVILDECFPPDTPVDTSSGMCHIKDIRQGDRILNALGEDKVSDVHKREVKSAIRITVSGVEPITSSPNHPYFTRRGWVFAKDLQPTDSIMETTAAMRLVWEGCGSESPNGIQQAILQQILFSEMADASASGNSGSSFGSSAGYSGNEDSGMVGQGQPGSSEGEGSAGRPKPNDRSRSESKGVAYIESDEAQASRAWGEWDGTHQCAIVSSECAGKGMDHGVRLIAGPTNSRISDELQDRHSKSRPKNSYRSGWKLPLLPEGIRRQKGCEIGFARVEGIEVLEPGHPDLERYRDAEGRIYFYDIGATRHPSFSVKGLLVHNSSILKSLDGATKRDLINRFASVPYRLCATATPSPNDLMEIGNHAEFLGVMTRVEMLSMFFVHDGGDTGQWRLKGHAEKEFYKWLCSFAVVVRRPSDLGYADDGYILRPMKRIQITIPADKPNDGYLIPIEAKTLNERRGARRVTLDQRVAACADIVNADSDQWMVWCGLNDESTALTAAIPGAVEVTGSDTREHKIRTMREFIAGKIRVVVSKLAILGFGMNLQCCYKWFHVGLSDSFEQLWQGDRRFWRFGQVNECTCYIVTSELEGAVVRNIERKEREFEAMYEGMVEHMRDEMNREVHGATITSDEFVSDRKVGDGWVAVLGDCVTEMRSMESDSVQYSCFSPPFVQLYVYSASERDMGNCKSREQFIKHMQFAVVELYRVIMPGRLVSFHCMNIPSIKERDGFIGLSDFRGDLIRLFESYGFIFHSEVLIWKDPLVAASRTHALGLAHKQIVKDAAMCRQGIPDYLVTMRKPGVNPEPVAHKPRGFERYIGEDHEPRREKSRSARDNKYSHEVWQRYASPVWMDINPSKTLQRESAREEKDERHVCPLQIQVIERAIELWTNPGDTVLDPFGGIGSTGYVALQMGRRAHIIELKRSYWEQAYRNLSAAAKSQQGGLFAQDQEDHEEDPGDDPFAA